MTPPGLERAQDEPATPTVEQRDIPRAVRAELKGLPQDLADTVAAHLVAAGALIGEDPELAYRHAEAARRRAARLPVVREAAAETAYAAGHFEVARNEFRTLRRMTGSADLVPVLADCERALGAPGKALALVVEAEPKVTDPAMRVELRLVQAGARADLGQQAEALRLLAHEIEHPFGVVPRPAQARLRYAYAALLLAAGDREAARSWFVAAARTDPDETDALDRLDELDGIVLAVDYDQLTDDQGNRLDEAEPEDREGEAVRSHPMGHQNALAADATQNAEQELAPADRPAARAEEQTVGNSAAQSEAARSPATVPPSDEPGPATPATAAPAGDPWDEAMVEPAGLPGTGAH